MFAYPGRRIELTVHTVAPNILLESRAFIPNLKPDSLTTYIQARVIPLEECISGARSIGLTVDPYYPIHRY